MIESTLSTLVIGWDISVVNQGFKHINMINKSHYNNGYCIKCCMNHIVHGSGDISLVCIVSYYSTVEQNLGDEEEDQ